MVADGFVGWLLGCCFGLFWFSYPWVWVRGDASVGLDCVILVDYFVVV